MQTPTSNSRLHTFALGIGVLFASWVGFAAKYDEMKYGPVIATTADLAEPAGNTVLKGLGIRLQAAVPSHLNGPIGNGELRESKNPVEGTELQEVYGTQREGSSGYLIHVPKGTYDVTLLFAEIWRKKAGSRVNDVYLQGEKVLADFDVAAEVDRFKALDKTFTGVKVTGYHLSVAFVEKSRYPVSIAGIVIKNAAGFERKINFGGPAVAGFEAGWGEKDGIADPYEAGVMFDTELLRWGGGWIDGYLTLRGTLYDDTHGPYPVMKGTQWFGTSAIPGWMPAGTLPGTDPREKPVGRLPDTWGHYQGMYRNGDNVVVESALLGGVVREQMLLKRVPGTDTQAFVRTLNLQGLTAAGRCLLLETAADAVVGSKDGLVTIALPDGQVMAIASVGSTAPLPVKGPRSAVVLDVPAGSRNCAAVIWRGPAEEITQFAAFVKELQPVDLTPLTMPGARAWAENVETVGTLHEGDDAAALVVDTVTLPDDNPWKSWMRPTAFDFFPGGTKAAVATWSGDVWTVDGLGGDLAKLSWQRVAAGIYMPLGVKVIDGRIYVNGRDQITVLEDRNNDGEADYYRNFNNDVHITNNFHEFSFDLEQDKDGWLYLTKAGPVKHGGKGFETPTRDNGTMMRISPDGRTMETFATGLRAPNGMSIGPDGTITTSDNEGTNMPTTPVNVVRRGAFFGVHALSHTKPELPREPPLCWIPHDIDNSGGGQAWVTSDKWGPYKDELLHISYGTCRVLHVMKEQVDGSWQGGVSVFEPAGRIGSGIIRGRFNEKDGQLYAAGLKGWQTRALYDGGMYRIRATGKPFYKPISLAAGSNGMKITFTQPLDPAVATDAGNYSIEQWAYSFDEDYGSAHYLPRDPATKGHEEMAVRSVSLLDDHTIFLELPNIAPVMQMQISMDIKAADGTPIKDTIWNTIHKLGAWSGKTGTGPTAAAAATLTPGLILRTRPAGTQAWVDARPIRLAALAVPAGTPASSRFAAGPFEASFDGFIRLKKKETARFSLAGAGHVVLTIDGKTVLDATSANLTEITGGEVELRKGDTPVQIDWTPAAGADAALRLYWQGADFPREPLPATVLMHNAADVELAAAGQIQHGRIVYARNHCAACHGDKPQGADVMPDVMLAGPDLTAIGGRVQAPWLAGWLRNPQEYRPGTTMPSVLNKLPADARDQAASDLATFLAASGTAVAPAEKGDAAAGKLLFDTLGCVNCHAAGPEIRGQVSLQFAANKFQPGALAAFILAPNGHNPGNRMPDFHVTAKEAADLEAAVLAASAMAKRAGLPAGDAVRGKALFQKMNCVACHQYNGIEAAPRLPSLFKANLTVGCLAGPLDDANHTRFFISEGDRTALAAFLTTDTSSLNRDPVAEYASRTIDALQCIACHARDGQQARWGEGGKGIPTLDFTGEKLDTAWLQHFMAGTITDKPRPWLASRMPAFPRDAERLAKSLAAEHGFGPEPAAGAEDVAIGKTLISATGGFACVICHGVGEQKAMAAFEAPGINLSAAGRRLRYDYYLRWMLDPQRIDQQSKMPKFALPGGKTALSQYCEGDAKRQFDAIWQYMKEVQSPKSEVQSRKSE